MSFATDASGISIAAAMAAETGVKATLGAIVGTYGVIKQSEAIAAQVALTERSVAVAERQLLIAESAYASITTPTYSRLSGLYDYLYSSVTGYGPTFLAQAFRFTEYIPQFAVAEARAMANVQRQFDNAALARRRQIGRYNTGRATHEAIWTSVMAALARVDAAQHAYRLEDERRRDLDRWYFDRLLRGVNAANDLTRIAVNAVNGAVNATSQGLSSSVGATRAFQGAVDQQAGALANRGDMWGSIANGAFRTAGFDMGVGSFPNAQRAHGYAQNLQPMTEQAPLPEQVVTFGASGASYGYTLPPWNM